MGRGQLIVPTIAVSPQGGGTISKLATLSGVDPSYPNDSAWQSYMYVAVPSAGYAFDHFEVASIGVDESPSPTMGWDRVVRREGIYDAGVGGYVYETKTPQDIGYMPLDLPQYIEYTDSLYPFNSRYLYMSKLIVTAVFVPTHTPTHLLVHDPTSHLLVFDPASHLLVNDS